MAKKKIVRITKGTKFEYEGKTYEVDHCDGTLRGERVYRAFRGASPLLLFTRSMIIRGLKKK